MTIHIQPLKYWTFAVFSLGDQPPNSVKESEERSAGKAKLVISKKKRAKIFSFALRVYSKDW
jgi:hypothetical protein